MKALILSLLVLSACAKPQGGAQSLGSQPDPTPTPLPVAVLTNQNCGWTGCGPAFTATLQACGEAFSFGGAEAVVNGEVISNGVWVGSDGCEVNIQNIAVTPPPQMDICQINPYQCMGHP